MKLADGLAEFLQHLGFPVFPCLVTLAVEDFHADIAFIFFAFGNLLNDIPIRRLEEVT